MNSSDLLKAQKTMYDYYYKKAYIPLPANTPAQLSAEWFRKRKDPRYPATVTGSVPSSWYFEADNPEGYDNCLQYLWGTKKKQFSDAAHESMKRGRDFEPVACARFYEWMRSKNKEIMIEESTFERSNIIKTLGASPDGVVHEKINGWILAKKGNFVIFRHKEGTINLTLAQAQKAHAQAQCSGMKSGEIPTQYISDAYNMSNGWTMNHSLSKCAAIFHIRSVLEIKCPKKMPSQPLLYYLPQIHLECFVTNTKLAYFVTYTTDNEQKERIRVWKIRFNECFWHRLLECINCMQSVQQDGTKGVPYSVFSPLFADFKRTYLKKANVWSTFIEPLFEKRKMTYEVPYNLYGVVDQYKGT